MIKIVVARQARSLRDSIIARPHELQRERALVCSRPNPRIHPCISYQGAFTDALAALELAIGYSSPQYPNRGLLTPHLRADRLQSVSTNERWAQGLVMPMFFWKDAMLSLRTGSMYLALELFGMERDRGGRSADR